MRLRPRHRHVAARNIGRRIQYRCGDRNASIQSHLRRAHDPIALIAWTRRRACGEFDARGSWTLLIRELTAQIESGASIQTFRGKRNKNDRRHQSMENTILTLKYVVK